MLHSKHEYISFNIYTLFISQVSCPVTYWCHSWTAVSESFNHDTTVPNMDLTHSNAVYFLFINNHIQIQRTNHESKLKLTKCKYCDITSCTVCFCIDLFDWMSLFIEPFSPSDFACFYLLSSLFISCNWSLNEMMLSGTSMYKQKRKKNSEHCGIRFRRLWKSCPSM